MKMKKTYILLTLLLSFHLVNAQGSEFTIPSSPGEVLAGQYIVLDVKGTPQENYKKVINYVNRQYNTPEEVFKSKIQDEYIRIEGASQLFNLANIFHMLEFHFKQDKIKLSLIDLRVSSPGDVTSSCTYDLIFKKNGKKRARYSTYAEKVIKGLNELSKEIELGINQEVKKDDNW